MKRRAGEEKAAVVEGTLTLNYAQLFEAVDRVAQDLAAQGVNPGSRVVFYCSDCLDDVIGSLAVLTLSAILIPLSPSFGEQELNDIYDRIGADYLVYESELLTQAKGIAVGKAAFKQKDFYLSRCENRVPLSPDIAQMNLAFIRFSSGTTGASKGVLLSHEAIHERTAAANQGMRMTDRDTVLWVLSMSYHFVVSILLFLRQGATICLCYENFPMSLKQALDRGLGSFIYASPFHYASLVDAEGIEGSALTHIRMAISTAMKLPPDIAQRFVEKFGLNLTEAYGIIEVGLPFINDQARDKPGSVGRLLPDYELSLRHQDQAGVGEIFIRGKGMYDGYASPWVKRQEITWFDTGDLGRLDNDGYLFIVGRKKNMINYAGMKVYPYEVETVLCGHPAVKEALVFGHPHPRYDQLPYAKVLLTDPVEPSELQSFCSEHLSPYKVPKRIEIVSALPKTASGKLSRVLEAEKSTR